jgi:transcriptional regulator with XRE-family HTH domain
MPTVRRDTHPMAKRSVREVLSANLEALMEWRQLSQPGVVSAAKRAGFTLDQTTVGRALNNTHAASIATLEALAAAFGREAWELLTPRLDPRKPVKLATEAALEGEVTLRLQALLDEASRLQVTDEEERAGPSVANPYPHVKTPGGEPPRPTSTRAREASTQAHGKSHPVKPRRR